MYCPLCGSSRLVDDAFCGSCGQRLRIYMPSNGPSVSASGSHQTARSKSRVRQIGNALATVLISLVLWLAISFFLGGTPLANGLLLLGSFAFVIWDRHFHTKNFDAKVGKGLRRFGSYSVSLLLGWILATLGLATILLISGQHVTFREPVGILMLVCTCAVVIWMRHFRVE